MTGESGTTAHTFVSFRLRGSRLPEKRASGWRFPARGKAVVRNRIKRLLREFFRLHADLLPLRADLVTVAKKNAGSAALDLERVRGEIVPLLRRMAAIGEHTSRKTLCALFMTCPYASISILFRRPCPLPAVFTPPAPPMRRRPFCVMACCAALFSPCVGWFAVIRLADMAMTRCRPQSARCRSRKRISRI